MTYPSVPAVVQTKVDRWADTNGNSQAHKVHGNNRSISR